MDKNSQKHVIETIARSISLTVDKTNTLKYGQKDQNSIIFNTLKTHLLPNNNLFYQEEEEE